MKLQPSTSDSGTQPVERVPDESAQTLDSRYLTRVAAIATTLMIGLLLLVHHSLPPDIHAEKLATFHQQAEQLEAISIGNSHGRSFHFESMGVRGMHFFEHYGDVEEALRRARAILPHTPNLQHVFFAITPGTLSHSQRSVAEDYEARRLALRKGTPTSLQLTDYSLEELLAYLSFRLLPIDHLQATFYEWLGYEHDRRPVDLVNTNPCWKPLDAATRNALQPRMIEEGILDGYRRRILEHRCIEEFARRNSLMRSENAARSLDDDPTLAERNLQRLLRFASELGERGIELVVVSAPVTEAYYRSPHFDALRAQLDHETAQLARHPNIKYFDYHDVFDSHVARGRNDFFYDDYHLALSGARVFSRLLGEALGVRTPEYRPGGALNAASSE